jgi:hypothetical protein
VLGGANETAVPGSAIQAMSNFVIFPTVWDVAFAGGPPHFSPAAAKTKARFSGSIGAVLLFHARRIAENLIF